MESKRLAPLIVIVGPTASGKSALALDLAERYNGEIICADSRTIYRSMDIGTAKPSTADKARVPHHVIDVVTPDQPFNAARFKELAQEAIHDILARGKIPFLVGGTGLYVDAVVFDYAFLPPGNTDEREHLNSLTTDELQGILKERGITLPLNERNPRHLIRAIETNGAVAVKKGLRKNTLMIGMNQEKSLLAERIKVRINQMVAAGFEAEVKELAEKYGWDTPAMQATGYRAFRAYIQGQATLDEATAAFVANDLDLAKRQRTWFKRNKDIHWIDDPAKAEKLVARFLQKA